MLEFRNAADDDHFRADVLRLLPIRLDKDDKPTGKRLVNDADLIAHGLPLHKVKLPVRSGNQIPESAGASLVIVYRDPSQPLRKIVFYDGIHIQSSLTDAMTQTLRGFYRSPRPNPQRSPTSSPAGSRTTTNESSSTTESTRRSRHPIRRRRQLLAAKLVDADVRRERVDEPRQQFRAAATARQRRRRSTTQGRWIRLPHVGSGHLQYRGRGRRSTTASRTAWRMLLAASRIPTGSLSRTSTPWARALRSRISSSNSTPCGRRRERATVQRRLRTIPTTTVITTMTAPIRAATITCPTPEVLKMVGDAYRGPRDHAAFRRGQHRGLPRANYAHDP